MIGVILRGGLGNQMFQYTAARVLAERHGATLCLVDDELRKDAKRSYNLGAFGIQLHSNRCSLLFNFQRRLRRIRLVKEERFGCWSDYDRLPDNVLLDGYWQCLSYVQEAGDAVDSWFGLDNVRKNDLDLRFGSLFQDDTVAVHIRRGDYVSCSQTAAAHQVCTQDYFDRALQTFIDAFSGCRFAMFSDDPEWVSQWVAERTGLDYIIVSGAEALTAADELHLMTQCQHHIISNSTFSWWGAWLGRHNGGKVIAPSKWFANQAFDLDELLPSNWERVDVK